MKLQHLVTVGDSWPAGAELAPIWHKEHHPDCFPNQIAQRLQVQSHNLAVSATSIDQALHQLLYNQLSIDWSSTVVLFCLTGMSRSMYMDSQGRTCELHPQAQHMPAKVYYRYLHSDQFDHFNRARNMLAAAQFCHSKGCDILFVSNWDPIEPDSITAGLKVYPHTLTAVLNIDTDFDRGKLGLTDLHLNPYVKPNYMHPNTAGHTRLADELAAWIKEHINDQSL